jgi:hypothetical protein
VPADAFAAAKVRELCTFLDLHIELVGRELYGQAFFGGSASESETQERVRKQLTKNIAAFKRLAKFSPYVAGDSSRWPTARPMPALPTVADGHQGGAGRRPAGQRRHRLEGLREAAGRTRPSVQRVAPTARRQQEAMAAAAKVGRAVRLPARRRGRGAAPQPLRQFLAVAVEFLHAGEAALHQQAHVVQDALDDLAFPHGVELDLRSSQAPAIPGWAGGSGWCRAGTASR